MNSECFAVAEPKSGPEVSLPTPARKATFDLVYTRAALYQAALKVYTKPLFRPEKGLATSHDGRTLYEFALHGPRNLERLHESLLLHQFHFREGVEIHFVRGRKRRTIYLFPWEERIVDEVLFHTLNDFFHLNFSEKSFAYRHRGFGVDDCQHRIARLLGNCARPTYLIKRDIRNYFPSVNQEILSKLLEQWVVKEDYLYELLQERVKFWVRDDSGQKVPGRGIPFGTAVACLLANICLTPLDQVMAGISGLTYFRYADDVLAFTPRRETALEASELLAAMLAKLRLESKISHEMNLVFTERAVSDESFLGVSKFRHLGLEFRADGSVGLSRAKGRKVRNLFVRAFDDAEMDLEGILSAEERARVLIAAAEKVIGRGVRSIAILDYYLKHVNDEEQLRQLDRWLAEEVLARVFQSGHLKANFRLLSFKRLREMGLPSLLHRRRLLRHGKLKSSFFILWANWLGEKAGGINAHRRSHPGREERGRLPGRKTLSPHLEAAAETTS